MAVTGFFERDPGNRSMIRLLSFLGFVLGSLVTIWGLVLLTLSVSSIMNGSIEIVPVVGTFILIISGGMALAAGGEVLKVVQQRGEVRETSARSEIEGGVREERSREMVLGGSFDNSGSTGSRGGL